MHQGKIRKGPCNVRSQWVGRVRVEQHCIMVTKEKVSPTDQVIHPYYLSVRDRLGLLSVLTRKLEYKCSAVIPLLVDAPRHLGREPGAAQCRFVLHRKWSLPRARERKLVFRRKRRGDLPLCDRRVYNSIQGKQVGLKEHHPGGMATAGKEEALKALLMADSLVGDKWNSTTSQEE